MKSRFPLIALCFFTLLRCALCQTYDISGSGKENSSGKQGQSSNPESQNGSGLSWGSSIEVARQARAAQDAINRHDYGSAVSFAQQAANSAPRDAELWFLLGYAARLAERYQVSLDAYNRGLGIQPNSSRGLAGLAQTYARMGRDADAERTLQKVINSNTKDATSLQLAGELLLNSDPKNSLQLLKRADSLEPSARTELLIARAYERTGNHAEFQHYMDLAKSRGPKNPEVMRAVAEEYREQGQYDLAISTLESLPGKSTDVQAELAYTYEVAGKQEEAAKLYSRLAKASKGNVALDLSAAQALVNLGQSDAASTFLDDARRLQPDNYRLHAIQGQIDESEDRTTDARSEYESALAHLPAVLPEGPLYPIELRLNLYELDLRQENQDDAGRQLKQATDAIQSVHVEPAARPEFLRLRAAIEAASGNLDAANKDLKDALELTPSNLNLQLNYGNLLWKLGQKDAAQQIFTKVLQRDKTNRTALSSLGYLARDKGDVRAAEAYFLRAASSHPKDFAPYLALGDLYTAERNLRSAENEYERAYERNPGNASTVAGGANAALEAHDLDLAKRWLDRAQGTANENPYVSRERERYLTFKQDYAASAQIGRKVLEKLPNDREAVVYLAYDLYYLQQFDEVRALVQKYQSKFSDDKDFALIAGYLDVHEGNLHNALEDFTRALERDPKMATGYVNRGFVLNDLREPGKAAQDFEAGIKLQPQYGEAHLGLAYADLQLHRPHPALTQLDAAGKILGKTHAWHLARAEAYRQGMDFAHAIPEYRQALDQMPNDLPTVLAYGDALYHSGHLHEAVEELAAAEKLSPQDAQIYALRAQIYARENDRDNAHRDIQLAEQYGNGQSKILMATGDAFLTLGERDAAMQRFSRILESPGEHHISVRLALARLFAERGEYDDTRRQVALGFAEARVEAEPISSQDILEAANLFLAIHDFDLAETYFDKAQLAGANSRSVTIGLTNTYLAEGKTQAAGRELGNLGPPSDFSDDYEYMMTAANLYRQRQDSVRSLSAFAQASSLASHGEGNTAEIAQYEEADQEGREINDKLSILPEGTFVPALEDINVYTLDAKILRVTNPMLLPPPRHSFQSLADTHYRIHLSGFPVISGFVGESLTAGRLLFPSVNVVEDRNTYDTFLNGGISPVLHFGTNSITFNGGLQYTIRRDRISPQLMSQNLFRQFLYVSTNSFFNWVSIHGSATREAGPFTDQDLHSRDAFANVEFTVGRPWGNTSLLAGYSARDLLFRPSVVEFFTTASYAGLQHKFGTRLSAALLAESLRSWEVFHSNYATAQALLPGARFDLRVNSKWSAHGSFVLSRGAGFHTYDNAQSEFTVSYLRPIHGTLKDGTADVPVSYPLRFSFGIAQQTFYNFGGSTRTTLLPVVHLTLF
ncbi:MAG TPA: tetratricopeptide repeat protein [Candidatus Sulfotelmatobacter sp.]|nr:tetratricopeptide repeat protein [Candidatus Sulfotelmatobacter sp.]